MHVPGWHERTKTFQREGRVHMAGIIQEQHPDRARLFMQWKKMDWPIMVDALDRLGIDVVPLTVLIDERGLVRAIRPDFDTFKAFLDEPAPAKPAAARPAVQRPDLAALEKAARSGPRRAQIRLADALVLWRGTAGLDRAIALYRAALRADPGDGPVHFRLGVALRERYESERRRTDDFARAVEEWGKALDIEPNQYIWRRRIQQYGPRLMKPYPFYDWVAQARADIMARGERPVALRVEPAGTELAHPARIFQGSPPGEAEPDPRGRIRRDEAGLIRVETTLVPARLHSGGAGRVHIVFRPDRTLQAHWNNKVGDLVLWISPPQGWTVDTDHLTVPSPREPVSEEPRRLEFEVKPPDGFTGSATIPAYALYYVCEGVNGTCLYRRGDIPITVEVRGD
ncbi:MAG: hypothetical protein ACE5HU_02815 [Acidobacteriota bacterium]